jgi:hypothetical protein
MEARKRAHLLIDDNLYLHIEATYQLYPHIRILTTKRLDRPLEPL